jgi:hypothetical protein
VQEFASQLSERIVTVNRQLLAARTEGDDYGVQVASGQMDHLLRAAAEHGIDVTALLGTTPKEG